MKKLFNRGRKPKQDWEEYEESAFNWDEPEEFYEGDGRDADDFAEEEYTLEEYMEEAAEEHTAEGYEEEYEGGPEKEYKAEEYRSGEYEGESEEEYRSEEYEGGLEEEYRSEEYEGEPEKEYRAEEYGEEMEEYPAEPYEEGIESVYSGETYGEDTEGYAGEEYGETWRQYDAGEDDIGEDTMESGGVYGSDEGYPETGDMPYEKGGRSVAKQGGRKKGFLGKLQRGLAGMSLMDRLILSTGVAVLVLALAVGSVYFGTTAFRGADQDFIDVGNQLEGIEIIGEAGLLAVADAQAARAATVEVLEENKEEPEEEPGKDYGESEYKREVSVTMELVSIQKDLKIKFVNEKTGKLVAHVPFSVDVTDPDGKTMIWSDDDMDGIIYKKDIVPGKYQVSMEALTDEKYGGYELSTLTRTVEVKKDIAYEKVAVANEIKTEDEVNVSAEDTARNETVVESVLQDTVAWVESSVLAASYTEVARSSIPDPMTLAVAKTFSKAALVNNDVSAGDSGLVKGTVTLAPATLSVVQGGIITSQADASDFTEGKALTYSISPAGNAYASVEMDNTGKITVTGIAAGSTQFTVTMNYAEGGTDETAASATLNVTVTPPNTLTLDPSTAVAFVGSPITLTATVPNVENPMIDATVQDASVASVSVSRSTVTVTGLEAGVTDVTVRLIENNVVTAQATCVVTVKAHPKDDSVTELKDASGNQLFVPDGNGGYRKAVYADYYVESNRFYLQAGSRYTGWQTIDGKVYFFTASGEKVTGEQVIQGVKYNFGSDGAMVSGTGEMGIDVSKWNGKIDWNAVKNSGVNYAIIRCGYRGSSAGSLIEDPTFRTNMKGATAAGLKVGVYFFTQAVDEREAVEEASMVLELIKNYTISYPVFLDVESSGGRGDALDKAARTAVCKAFCQTIQNANYTTGIYANKTWLESKIDVGALGGCKVWLAQYATTPTYTGRYEMWQYRANGSVSGISGEVDMNLSYLGY